MGFAMVILIIVAPYRLATDHRVLAPAGPVARPAGWQTVQGTYAVGSGGWFGVGLGAGRLKWGWVPNATTDFIFAIIGEELGLVGTLCVTPPVRRAAPTPGCGSPGGCRTPSCAWPRPAATAWIVVQALVNIGAVIGLLPITGVPLPLVSAGLSSLLVTMAALGMLMSFAKREPGASPGTRRCWPRAGAARPKLAWPGQAARSGSRPVTMVGPRAAR